MNGLLNLGKSIGTEFGFLNVTQKTIDQECNYPRALGTAQQFELENRTQSLFKRDVILSNFYEIVWCMTQQCGWIDFIRFRLVSKGFYYGIDGGLIQSLSNKGDAAVALKDDKNLFLALIFWKKSLAIIRKIFPGNYQILINLLEKIGNLHCDIGKKLVSKQKNTQLSLGLMYREEALTIKQKQFPQDEIEMAKKLFQFGVDYHNARIGGLILYLNEEEDLLKGLKYAELALKIRQELLSDNHLDVAVSLRDVAISYNFLGDKNKALEYFKQAYSIFLIKNGEKDEQTLDVFSRIESLQPGFFGQKHTTNYQDSGNPIGCEYRKIIFSRGQVTDELIRIKQKIQSAVLNVIVAAVMDYGWEGFWGVKGYTDKIYLKNKLGLLGTSDNIELAQILCFEAITIGIMKFPNKCYPVIRAFTQENPDLVNKIAVEHPEFFTDGSIIEFCLSHINHAQFNKSLLENIRYIGKQKEVMY